MNDANHFSDEVENLILHHVCPTEIEQLVIELRALEAKDRKEYFFEFFSVRSGAEMRDCPWSLKWTSNFLTVLYQGVEHHQIFL